MAKVIAAHVRVYSHTIVTYTHFNNDVRFNVKWCLTYSAICFKLLLSVRLNKIQNHLLLQVPPEKTSLPISSAHTSPPLQALYLSEGPTQVRGWFPTPVSYFTCTTSHLIKLWPRGLWGQHFYDCTNLAVNRRTWGESLAIRGDSAPLLNVPSVKRLVQKTLRTALYLLATRDHLN